VAHAAYVQNKKFPEQHCRIYQCVDSAFTLVRPAVFLGLVVGLQCCQTLSGCTSVGVRRRRVVGSRLNVLGSFRHAQTQSQTQCSPQRQRTPGAVESHQKRHEEQNTRLWRETSPEVPQQFVLHAVHWILTLLWKLTYRLIGAKSSILTILNFSFLQRCTKIPSDGLCRTCLTSGNHGEKGS